MTGVITWFIDCGDGVGVERSPQSMNDFFKGLTVVGLGMVAGACLGALGYSALDVLFPQPSEASLAIMVARNL